MEMISGIASGAARMPLEVQGTKEEIKTWQADEVRKREEGQGSLSKPVRDEYIPEEEQEPGGRYWIGRDENGSPKVYFDDPEKSEPDSEPEICRGSTDKADREIEKLKKEKEKLEQQIRSETDETKIRELERKLSQVESELSRKDNDAYRRQHAVFS